MAARRNTQQKEIIRHTLCRMCCHPTAVAVFEEVRRTHPTISRSTVYRVLGQLTEEGEILRLHLAGEDVRYDGNTSRWRIFRRWRWRSPRRPGGTCSPAARWSTPACAPAAKPLQTVSTAERRL